MIRRLTIGTSMLVMSWAVTAQEACTTHDESVARAVRHMQTQLMVGALQCRGDENLGQRDHYNSFVRLHRERLQEHSAKLVDGFRNQSGPGFQSNLDRFLTNMANDVSLKSQQLADYCHQVAELGSYLTKEDGGDWEQALHLAPLRYAEDTITCRSTNPGGSINVD